MGGGASLSVTYEGARILFNDSGSPVAFQGTKNSCLSTQSPEAPQTMRFDRRIDSGTLKLTNAPVLGKPVLSL